jgi:hypothetical protein
MKSFTISCLLLPVVAFQLLSCMGLIAALVLVPEASSRYSALNISGGAIKTRKRGYSFGRSSPKLDPPSTKRGLSSIPTEGNTVSPESETGIWNSILISLRTNTAKSIKTHLVKNGLAAILTYFMTGNIVNVSCLSFAWYGFSKQTGMSPMFPGQWKSFMPVAAGVMAAEFFLKPLQLAVSLGLAPLMDRALSWLRRKLRGSKAMAIGVVVSAALISSLGFFAGGISLASYLAGVPIFAP